MTEPSPGPTFEIDVAAPDIEVTKSKPLKDKKAVIKKNFKLPRLVYKN